MDYGYAYGGLIAGAIIGTIFLVILGIVAYIFTALGLMKLAENKGIENPWLAWIPIANLYILGLLVKEVNVFGQFDIPRLELVIPGAFIVSMIFSGVPVLGFILSLAVFILMILVLYKLFSMYRPDSAVLFTVISAIGFFWILIFVIRNDNAIQ